MRDFKANIIAIFAIKKGVGIAFYWLSNSTVRTQLLAVNFQLQVMSFARR